MNNESDSEPSGFASGAAIKIIGVVVAVLLIVYLGTTWLVGRTAQARVDVLVKQATEQLTGQLKLVERKSSPGFFSTTEDLTFTLDNPLYAAMLSKALPQFTIRNVISHGPLPGLRSIGIARIDTTLVMTDEQRKSLVKILGTDRPLGFVTTLGWSGSADLDIDSPKMMFDLPDGGGKVDWKGLHADAHYSPDAKRVTASANIPSVIVAAGNEIVTFENFAADIDMQSRFDSLYAGNESFTLESFSLTRDNKPVTKVTGIRYIIDLTDKNDYLNVIIKAGADSIDLVAPNAPQNIKDVHFDFSIEHLHGPTLASLTKTYQAYSISMQEAMSAALKSTVALAPADADGDADADAHSLEPAALSQVGNSPAAEAQLSQLKAQAITLLQRTPILKINHIGYATTDGDLKLTGSAQLNEVALEDLEPTPNPQYLITKLFASGEFSVAQSAIDHWSLGMPPDQAKQTFAQLEQEGFVKRNGNRLESHLEFKEGKITANGKLMGPP